MAGYAVGYGTVYDCESGARISGAYCQITDNYGYWVNGYTDSTGYFAIGRYFPGYNLTLQIQRSGYYTRYYYGNTSSFYVYYYCLNKIPPAPPSGGGGWT